MCGLAAASSRRLQHTSSLQHAPEQQLAAFLTLMGLTALPGQQQLTAPHPAAGVAAVAGPHGLPGATGNQSGDAKAAGGKQTTRKSSSTGKQADPFQGSMHLWRGYGVQRGVPTSISHSQHRVVLAWSESLFVWPHNSSSHSGQVV